MRHSLSHRILMVECSICWASAADTQRFNALKIGSKIGVYRVQSAEVHAASYFYKYFLFYGCFYGFTCLRLMCVLIVVLLFFHFIPGRDDALCINIQCISILKRRRRKNDDEEEEWEFVMWFFSSSVAYWFSSSLVCAMSSRKCAAGINYA